jgi:hypothetical protein
LQIDDTEDEMGRVLSILREKRIAYRVSVRTPEGRRALGRPGSRFKMNIKMDLLEVLWVGMDLIELAQYSNHWRALENM